MSYGTGPYGIAATGSALPTPAEETRATLTSSRGIDFARKRYRITDDGGFEAMDDVAQTVVLRLSYGFTPPRHVTAQAVEQAKVDIRRALVSMTRGPEPLIELLSVVVETGPGAMRPRVSYRNLRTNTKQTLAPIA